MNLLQHFVAQRPPLRRSGLVAAVVFRDPAQAQAFLGAVAAAHVERTRRGAATFRTAAEAFDDSSACYQLGRFWSMELWAEARAT